MTLQSEIAESGETPVDETVAAERADREGCAFLAREFLTWLVFHADVEGGEFPADNQGRPGRADADFTIGIGGRVTLRTPTGMVTDMAVKGSSPGCSPDVRYALAGGLSVKEADLVLEQGDRIFTFGLASEYFDLKRVKLPALLAEEEDDRVDERMALLRQLDDAVRAAFVLFLDIRTDAEAWASTVAAIRGWLDKGTRP